MTTASELISRSDRLLSERSSYDQKRQEISDQLGRATGFNRENTPGQKKFDVLDSTGIQAHKMLAAGLHGMLTNPAQLWFGFRPKDEELQDVRNVMIWTEQATKRCYSIFNSSESNFKSQVHELFLDTPGYGMGCMYVPDEPGRGILFSTIPLNQICIAENFQGVVDTVYRRFKLTARQAVQKWGNRVGEKVAKAAADEKKMDDYFVFLHCVFPRLDGRVGAMRRRKPFASFWVSLEDKHLIDEGGFDEMAYLTPRWEKLAGDVYGSGAGETALADLKMLQRVMRVTIRGGEKMIDPSLMVTDDGVIGLVRTNPSGITTVRASHMTGQMDPIRPLLTGGRPDIGEQFMEGIRGRVRGAFHWNLLQMMQDPRMTATQVVALQEELLRVMGPVLGRQESEFLGPLVTRVFNILLRAGALPPPPPELQGREIEIEYMSPVARAQRGSEAQAIIRTIDAAGSMANLDPDVRDNIDIDESFRRLSDLYGHPKDLLRDIKDVQKRRDGRAQAAEAARQQEEMAANVNSAATAAQALPAIKQALTPGTATAGNA